MSAELDALIHRVRQGLSSVELVYTSHECWPLPLQPSDPSKRLRISVLDSSFNPPTLAHLALANISPQSSHSIETNTHGSAQRSDFDARLLLLSVRNADKSLKPTDATYAQRLQMMTLLAKQVAPSQDPRHSAATDAPGNVAVAIIDEPTFVGKSRTLHAYLQSRLSSLASVGAPQSASGPFSVAAPKPELTFVVGIDTLERILAVRYYDTEDNMRRALQQFLSASGDASRLICARRVTPGSLEAPDDRERRVGDAVGKYLEPGRVEMVDIGADVESYSSSEVRQRIAEGDSLWTRMVPGAVVDYIQTHGLYSPSKNDI